MNEHFFLFLFYWYLLMNINGTTFWSNDCIFHKFLETDDQQRIAKKHRQLIPKIKLLLLYYCWIIFCWYILDSQSVFRLHFMFIVMVIAMFCSIAFNMSIWRKFVVWSYARESKKSRNQMAQKISQPLVY